MHINLQIVPQKELNSPVTDYDSTGFSPLLDREATPSVYEGSYRQPPLLNRLSSNSSTGESALQPGIFSKGHRMSPKKRKEMSFKQLDQSCSSVPDELSEHAAVQMPAITNCPVQRLAIDFYKVQRESAL